MLYDGALPWQIDDVMTKFGMAMGPFAMVDLSSLEGSYRMRKEAGIKSPIEDALCEAGRWGQRWGKGYYKYEDGSRVPIPDPEVEKLIDETLTRLGRKRGNFSDEEILERLIYPMINEGARILEEGIAARPGDIDLVWLYGFAWPPIAEVRCIGPIKLVCSISPIASLSMLEKPATLPLNLHLCCVGLPTNPRALLR